MNKIQHLTVCLIEELSEVQKALTKSLRFGYDDIFQGKTNLEYVRQEFEDIFVIINRLEQEGIDTVNEEGASVDYCLQKDKKLDYWLNYAKTRGILE